MFLVNCFHWPCVCMCAELLQSCLTLCDSMDCLTLCDSMDRFLWTRDTPDKNIGAGSLPSPGRLLVPGIEPVFLKPPTLVGGFFTTRPSRKPLIGHVSPIPWSLCLPFLFWVWCLSLKEASSVLDWKLNSCLFSINTFLFSRKLYQIIQNKPGDSEAPPCSCT